MISCVAWVPKGVADPSPKRYEMSAAEMELLEKQAEMEQNDDKDNNTSNDDDNDDDMEEENEEEENEDTQQQRSTKKTNKTTTSSSLPIIDPKSLPADLRMDEYSDNDDDDDNNNLQGAAMLGNLLVGNDGNEMIENELKGDNDNDDDEWEDIDAVRDDSDDDDSDDDLADVPDTREYTPIDVGGLEAMGLSQVGGSSDYYKMDGDQDEEDEGNDSDAEDVKLTPDDAIVLVAKTDEVRVFVLVFWTLAKRCVCFSRRMTD